MKFKYDYQSSIDLRSTVIIFTGSLAKVPTDIFNLDEQSVDKLKLYRVEDHEQCRWSQEQSVLFLNDFTNKRIHDYELLLCSPQVNPNFEEARSRYAARKTKGE